MPTKRVANPKRNKSLYVGEKVILKNGKRGEVLEIEDGPEFCIQYPDGTTEWVPKSSIV